MYLKMHNILILEPECYSQVSIHDYSKVGSVHLGANDNIECKDVTILVVRLGYTLNEKYLSKFKALKIIVSPTTALTHVDIEYCSQLDIKIYSLQDCKGLINSVTSTSELTMGLILSLLRYIPKSNSSVVNDNMWNRDLFRSRQLSRMKIGIIGLGRIGGHVAMYAKSFGMEVSAYDPYQPDSRFKELCVAQESLRRILENSDIVTIHANLRLDNHGLISYNEIDIMKDGVLLINTARGEILNEQAVSSGLINGKIGGIAVDVLESEHKQDHWSASPLVELAKNGGNILITPHIGGCTTDAMHITEEHMSSLIVAEVMGGVND
jgi:D-3-phosphoglycerate dehydrogenase / 2-oxoglutarate reductase